MTPEEQWRAARLKHVSSTESAALFGMSPYLTAYELGVMKQSGQDSDVGEGERIVWGRRLQDAIAQGISSDYGVLVESAEFEYASHPTVERMGSSFDYRIVGAKFDPANHFEDMNDLFQENGPGLLEIKNVDSLIFRYWPDEDLPDHIEIQVQHQMEVSRLAWCAVAVFVGGNRTVLYVRMRDAEVGAAIAAKVDTFWKNLDKGILPPAILPQDADIIIRLHQYADPDKVLDAQGNATLASLCEEYTSAGEIARSALAGQKSIKAQILSFIGNSERALVDGFKLSAAMVAPTEVKAHTREGYRNLRITKSEQKHERR